MTTFKVGDKVRATQDVADIREGWFGRVERIDGDRIFVRFKKSVVVFLYAGHLEHRPDPTTKQTNPKDSIGSDKIPLHLWPTTATVLGSMALLDGGLKYGRSNFRAVGVRATIYIDAIQRHAFRWASGEDHDPDSGLSHLAHILAGVAILVDAQAAGKLNDDREIQGGLLKLIEEMTPHVKRLKEQHKDKSPKHYTIADNEDIK